MKLELTELIISLGNRAILQDRKTIRQKAGVSSVSGKQTGTGFLSDETAKEKTICMDLPDLILKKTSTPENSISPECGADHSLSMLSYR